MMWPLYLANKFCRDQIWIRNNLTVSQSLFECVKFINALIENQIINKQPPNYIQHNESGCIHCSLLNSNVVFFWCFFTDKTRMYAPDDIYFDLVIHYKEKKRGLGLSGKSPQRTWDVLCRTCCCPKQSLGGPCQLPPKHVCSSSSSDRHE